jgi:hypothetical protein
MNKLYSFHSTNSQFITTQDEKALASLANTVGVNVVMKTRGQEVLKGITATVSRAVDIQKTQSTGLTGMVSGLASNTKACRDSTNNVSI